MIETIPGTTIEIIPGTPHLAAHVHVGRTPTGAAWNVYTRPDESFESLLLRVTIMTQQFDRTVERQDRSVIKVTRLTQHSVDMIVERGQVYEMFKDDYEAAKFGRSFVVASRRFLEAVAEDLECFSDDHGDCAVGNVFKDNVSMQDFAYKQARNSTLICAKRLRIAVEGKKQPRRVRLETV